MSLIRSKNTKPETEMAKMLDEAGVRYVRYAKLPGSPDFLLDNFVVLFVDGDFWHGRNFDNISPRLAPFWKKKLINNIRRDARVDRRLRRMGFSVIRIWETKLRKKPERCLRRIADVQMRSIRNQCYRQSFA